MRTLYVSDLDQTLLRSDGTVSFDTARLLNAAVKRDVLFTYATARSFRSSRRVTASLGLALPVITYGGTITADPTSGVATEPCLLDGAVVEAVIAACAARGDVQPILHTYEDGRDRLRWRLEGETSGTAVYLAARSGDPRLKAITSSDPVDLAAVFYIAILAPRRIVEALRETLRPALRGCAHFLSDDMSTPGFSWLELHSAAGTKAQAIHRLMRKIGADRLVVFGDNHNDVPMFEIADESYAVANAIPELQAIATSVIDDNDSDAVARFIATRTPE
jgi:hydroxymethylpyrimidine pyrophosphatase-like HAD family hydrolase